MTTLKGVFPDSKPIKGKNFIHENVKNLRRIEHSHINKGIEVQKSQVYNRKKIISNNNNNNHNRNHNSNVLSKNNTNFRFKKHDNDINLNINNKQDQHQQLCKKYSALVLNKNNVSTKKTIYSASNNSLIKEKKKEHKELNKSTQKLYAKISSDPNFSYKSVENNDNNMKIQVKNQGIQTLNTKEIDDLYSEGIIKYPSKKYLNNNESINKNDISEQIDISSKTITSSPSDRGDVQILEKSTHNKNDTKNSKVPSPKEEINFIKLNKEHTSMTNKMVTQTNNNINNNNTNNNNTGANDNHHVLPANYRMGVIPKYIKNRKEIQKRMQKAKVEEQDPNCPNKHVPLPDNERKETLRMLKKNYQDYVNELNMMPIKVDTLRAQQRKIEIEKQLNKLEEGIKVFSRPKVYVKMNA
ncbi:PREDICTED: putative uncharacterized protein DDB_G0282499 [Eufriesea mexicana]|uniref:putative uncharacterized protein DDB_G0282499 n=1 Tax=Eufriesea mexicana TaxID=516756 RepID=UPI00083C1197|nr:PREDICTED: putative uncharacterized protein DDB_G0282499 [Eufriesea mexicana]